MLIPVPWAFEIIVVLLAVARVTRLVAADEVTRGLRETIAQWLREGSPLVYLLYCRWCLSIWIAFPSAGVWWALSTAPRWSGHWWVDVPTVALALSHATGLLVHAEPED
jgi:hypothetical protein